MRLGAPAADAPLMLDGAPAWLLRHTGNGFTGIHFAGNAREAEVFAREALPVRTLVVVPQGQGGPGVFEDSEGVFAARYDATPGSFYLLRPDQHLCARWRRVDLQAVREALARASGMAVTPAGEAQAAHRMEPA
jgi:3-(3-hydroxy-phenyl)propionate hydroxylase